MNGILYLLIGGCVAGAIAAAFFQKQDIGKISSTDVFVAASFILALAGVACFLKYSRWGRKLRTRMEQKEADADDRVRTNARTKGEVRTPPFS
jgi:branched-subunit amino acid ABC-type transport system permease component